MANYGGRGFARRMELIRAKGFRTEGEYRRASKAEREAGAQRAAAAGAYRSPRAAKQAREQIAPPVRRLVDLGGGRQLVRSMRNPELYAFLRRAEQRDLRVWGIVERSVPNNEPPPAPPMVPYDTIQLWRRGGIDPSYILDELRAARSRDVIAWLDAYLNAPDAGPAAQNTLGRSPRVAAPPAGGDELRPIISMVQLSSGVARGASGEAA